MSGSRRGGGMPLVGRDAVRHAAATLLPRHPWPAVALADAIAVVDGAVTEGPDPALAWHGGNPWNPAGSTLNVLGGAEDGAGLLAALAGPGDHAITTPAILDALDARFTGSDHGGVGRYEWDLRTVRAPLPILDPPEHTTVGWLRNDPPTNADIDALLDASFAHASLRPGDPRAGRWCGIRDGSALTACAAQTLPAAPIAHLSSLAVLPDTRRGGLGAALTTFFVAEAFAAGAPYVVLAVDADNVRGIALYDRLGFDTWHLAGITVPLGAS
jgi:ribosomal protein S18 acetylase RimI-like enzyme